MTADEQRRAETRQKIQLGGLIIKAGLHTEDAAIILGALRSAVAEIAADPSKREVYRSLGDAAFRK